MAKFSNWFIDFFFGLMIDIWSAIKSLFIGIYNGLIGNWIGYYKDYLAISSDFGLLDKILSIFISLEIVLIYLLIVIIVAKLITKYIIERKIKTEKMLLLNQLNILQKKLKEAKPFDTSLLTDKKDEETKKPEKKKSKLPKGSSRFTKLNLIDQKYSYNVLPTVMEEKDEITLKELVDGLVNYAAYHHNLYYTHKTIAAFVAGMAISKIIILEGFSGTGKTSLPYVFGRYVSKPASIISVQPSWRDRFEMMGYFNEFTKKFNETEFLSSVYESTFRTDVNLIVLDEINLARVEYYFADFLSLLELPDSDEWLLEIVAEQQLDDPVNLKEGKIKIPTNIWFVGTANNDDSTFAITDKVYDRAASILMNRKAQPLDGKDIKAINISAKYLENLFEEALKEYEISEKYLHSLEMIDVYISETFQLTFGNRIMKQIVNFVPVYMACGGTELEAIDHMIERKIIRKFEMLNLPFLRRELEELINLFEKYFGRNALKETVGTIKKFIKQV